MADAKTHTQREAKEKNPQAPQQNPQRQEDHRAEHGKRQGTTPEFGKQPAEKVQPADQKREEEQHHEKQQGQKMPQQQKKDDQGGCGCG
jgi:hypothetical protein